MCIRDRALAAAAPSTSAAASSHDGGKLVEADGAIEAVEGKNKERKTTIVPPEVKVWFVDFCQKMEHKKKWNQRQCLHAAAELCSEYFAGLEKCIIYVWIDPATTPKLVENRPRKQKLTTAEVQELIVMAHMLVDGDGVPFLLVMDCAPVHISRNNVPNMMDAICEDVPGCHPCIIPRGTISILQPCDSAYFRPLKEKIRHDFATGVVKDNSMGTHKIITKLPHLKANLLT
eukprot:4205279-Amphidinium_carterae.2